MQVAVAWDLASSNTNNPTPLPRCGDEIFRTMRHFTTGLLLAVTVVLTLWECYTLSNHVEGDTISDAVRQMNIASGGLIALGCVALWVHLFGPTIWR